MRKTEVIFGTFAGVAGILLAILSISGVLPYSERTLSVYTWDTIRMYSSVCLGASAVGILGALLVLKDHILGSIIMAIAMIILLVFGFPWQTISAVAFIISVVLAVVPVKIKTDTIKGGEPT